MNHSLEISTRPNGTSISADAPAIAPEVARPRELPAPTPLENEMLSTYWQVRSLLPTQTRPVLQLVYGEARPPLRALAGMLGRTVAARMGINVILLESGDPAGRDPLDRRPFAPPLEEAIHRSRPLRELVRPGEGGLAHGRLAMGREGQALDLAQYGELFQLIRQHYALCLIHAGPAMPSADALALAGQVDGVLLLAEAERTRRDSLMAVRRRVEVRGGRILGVVLANARQSAADGF